MFARNIKTREWLPKPAAMAPREEPRLSHGEELRMQHLFDGDELEEFIYTLRCKLLTRRRRCVTTRERLPHSSSPEPLRTVVPHLGPWLDGAASVAALLESIMSALRAAASARSFSSPQRGAIHNVPFNSLPARSAPLLRRRRC